MAKQEMHTRFCSWNFTFQRQRMRLYIMLECNKNGLWIVLKKLSIGLNEIGVLEFYCRILCFDDRFIALKQ